MRTQAIAAGLALAVGIAMVLTLMTGDTGPCPPDDQGCLATDRPSPTAAPTGLFTPTPSPPIATPGASPTPTASAAPTPVPTAPVYTFRDEFDSRTLKRVWGRHWPGFGTTIWSRSQISIADGVLTIKARKSGSKWVSDLIDTVGTFTQKYGVFSARMKFVQGNGLWPAFWLAQPQNKAKEEAEIDIMEVCANDVGGHDGNDVTLLHHYVHKIDGSHAFAYGHRTESLGGEWHVYSVDWRKDRMTFYLDGLETSTFTFTSDTDVSDMKMAIVLDLAIGGRFCNVSDDSTPKSPTLQVDWVRVTK